MKGSFQIFKDSRAHCEDFNSTSGSTILLFSFALQGLDIFHLPSVNFAIYLSDWYLQLLVYDYASFSFSFWISIRSFLICPPKNLGGVPKFLDSMVVSVFIFLGATL